MPVTFSLSLNRKQRWMERAQNKRERERDQTAVRGWGGWEQIINKSNETLRFIEEGRRSRALTSVNLMSQFCSFLLCVSFTSIISPALLLHSFASQLRQMPAGKAGRWSIFYRSSSASQAEWRWWRQRHKDKAPELNKDDLFHIWVLSVCVKKNKWLWWSSYIRFIRLGTAGFLITFSI